MSSQVQKEFIDWFKKEKQINGLKSMSFYPGDLSTATVDSFILELREIDKAIESGKVTPLPESF